MSGYHDLTTLATAIRSGIGTPVVCEGESADQDQSCYSTWFAPLATRISFFAQDGWPKVAEAVAHLRGEQLPLPVYGLIDRDYHQDARAAAQHTTVPPDHIFCTDRVTLENYLLEPDGWFAVVRALHSRQPDLPAGWDTPAAVQSQLEAFFTAALPTAAHNWTVSAIDQTHHTVAGFTSREHYQHTKALEHRSPETLLEDWAGGFGAGAEAVATFGAKLADLQKCKSLAELHSRVHGRLVLAQLQESFPFVPGRPRLNTEALLDLYLDKHPEPPDDLASLITRILDCADAERHAGRSV